MRRRAGFTLFEVTVVIVIIAVLASMVMPRMKGSFQSARLKEGARGVAGFLRFARNTAVLREKPCEIRFNLDKDQYWIVLLDSNLEEWKEPRRQENKNKKLLGIGEDVAGVRTLPKDVHFLAMYSGAPLTEKGLPRVIYYPDGSATPATIVIEGTKKAALNIEVYQTTGIAHVEPGVPADLKEKKKLYYGPKSKELENR